MALGRFCGVLGVLLITLLGFYLFEIGGGDHIAGMAKEETDRRQGAPGPLSDVNVEFIGAGTLSGLEVLEALLNVLVDSRDLWPNDERYIAVSPTTRVSNGWVSLDQVLSDVGKLRGVEVHGLASALMDANAVSRPLVFESRIEGVRFIEDPLQSVKPSGARGWVEFWWPTKSSDESEYLVRFGLDSVLDASMGTAFLRRTENGVLRVVWIDLGSYW